jgi:hypothetical protein
MQPKQQKECMLFVLKSNTVAHLQADFMGLLCCKAAYDNINYKSPFVLVSVIKCLLLKIQTPWLWSMSELYRPSHRYLLAKLVPTFADRGCRVVSAMDPHSHIVGFLDQSRYYFPQVAPQLYSGG